MREAEVRHDPPLLLLISEFPECRGGQLEECDRLVVLPHVAECESKVVLCECDRALIAQSPEDPPSTTMQLRRVLVRAFSATTGAGRVEPEGSALEIGLEPLRQASALHTLDHRL